VAEKASLHAIVHGIVQGVFFRDFSAIHARRLGLSGFVRNLPDGTVEVNAEGEKVKLEELVEKLKQGPPSACVSEVSVTWSPYSGSYNGFGVLNY
jgi:acylphosphatase